MRPSAERLRELLNYEPDTGRLTWRSRLTRTDLNGLEAGTLDVRGYRAVFIDGYRAPGHRAIWCMQTGRWPVGHVDHINGERADNRWENLREVTMQGNAHNRRKPHKNNKIGLLGVTRNKLRFEAGIKVNGKHVYIGLFKTAEEAHAAYVEAKRRLHPTSTI